MQLLWAVLLASLGGAIALPFGVFRGGLRAAQKFMARVVVSTIADFQRDAHIE